MGEERDTFWQLERANRRKTVELVAIFVLIYAVCGCGLDFVFHTLRVVNHQLAGVPWLTIVAVAIASAQAVWAYYHGSSLIIGAVHGYDLTPQSVKEQTVVDVVSEMALAARVPAPRVCLMEDPAPNAFATGRDPEHSAICVTRGLVDQLDREELQGVIAHEMAHIRGHDVRVTQMATVMVGGFALLYDFAFRMSAAIRLGGGAGDAQAAIPGVGLIAIPMFILGMVGWSFSKMVAIALSREREYLADASSTEFTRNPHALIRALEHIARIESPLKAALRGVAPLFIVDPFECGGASRGEFLDEIARIEAQEDKTKERRDAEVADLVVKGMAQQNLFQGALSSHPPIHDRIARLYGLLHQPSAAPPPGQVDAKRGAAAKAVAEVTRTNPDAAAAVIESILRARPGEQLMRALGADLRASGSDPVEPSEDPPYANASDQAAYKQLYEYNLEITGDKPRSPAGHVLESGSPLEAVTGGQPGTIDPAQLRAALAIGMASMHKKSAASPASVPGEPAPSKKLLYLCWLVVALSAGAIVAALATR